MRTLGNYLAYKIWGRKPAPRPRRAARRCGPARSWRYRTWIRLFPCLICGRHGSEAAHTGLDGGKSQKASDFSCLPLCPECHTFGPKSYHVLLRERFQLVHGIDLDEKVVFFNCMYREKVKTWKSKTTKLVAL